MSDTIFGFPVIDSNDVNPIGWRTIKHIGKGIEQIDIIHQCSETEPLSIHSEGGFYVCDRCGAKLPKYVHSKMNIT